MLKINEDLLAETQRIRTTIQDGIEWIEHESNANRIGDAKNSIIKDLKRGSVEAKRLSGAASRPMAVAVFGASQAGKSHLISVLARKGDDLLVDFNGNDPVSYIKQINIDQKGESTGLVTRFTIRREETPDGYPVCLRLLSHADIIKIIANAYYFDGRPNRFPERSDIAEHIQNFEEFRAKAPEANGLSPEDVWDLQDYFKQYLARSPLTDKLDPFWNAAQDLCPNMPISRLGAFFSILWGEEEIITKLYIDLGEALRKLGFPKDAYIPLDSIIASKNEASETNKNTISVITVAGLTDISTGSAQQISVKAGNGAPVNLPRSTVCALTAEIWITLHEWEWDFFEHTDLLDFPGYRSRGLKAEDMGDEEEPEGLTGISKYLVQSPDTTLQLLLLRGKVEYLFHRYVAEQEITSMLLCAQPNNLEVDQLPQVVSKWIATTHGARPEDRMGKDELLFLVLTKFDMHFERKTSDESFGYGDQMNGALDAPLLKAYGNTPDSWVRRWTPGETFKNCYLMRNPNILKGELFEIKDYRELYLKPDIKPFVNDLKEAFVNAPLVRDYIRNPATAFDEMLKENDGGARYIARNLSPICDPGIKEKQIRFRLSKLQQRLRDKLAPYYVSVDPDDRLQERMAIAGRVYDDLLNCDGRQRFGSLVKSYMISTAALSDCLHEASLMRTSEPARPDKGEDGAQTRTTTSAPPSGRPRPGGLPASTGRPLPAGLVRAAAVAEAPAGEPAAPPNASFGRSSRNRVMAEAAVRALIDHVYERADDETVAHFTEVAPENLKEIAQEIAQTAQRIGLVDLLQAKIDRIIHHDKRDEFIDKISVAAERLLNGFIADLGTSLLPAEGRAEVHYPTGPVAAFQSPPLAFDATGIAETPDPFAMRYVDSWLHAFIKTVSDNAQGSMLGVDVELNAQLGDILARLGSSNLAADPQGGTQE